MPGILGVRGSMPVATTTSSKPMAFSAAASTRVFSRTSTPRSLASCGK